MAGAKTLSVWVSAVVSAVVCAWFAVALAAACMFAAPDAEPIVCIKFEPVWDVPDASAPGGPVRDRLAEAVPAYSVDVATLALMPKFVVEPRLIALLVPVLLL